MTNQIEPPPSPLQKKAIIYCRVSSKRQKTEGTGLASQEHRCRLYADERNYDVEAVFPDDISGGGDFMNRPGMVALLAYLDAKPEENYIVIFDDLKRYARDTEFHLKLRREMAARNAVRECLNFDFQDTPEGKFIETMLAAQGELEREQNGRQVVQKMKARLEQGLWPFAAPKGYKYGKSEFGGKQLFRDEPLASIITEALESFASGKFQTRTEVKRFLESQPAFPKDKKGHVHGSRVVETLNRVIYAGYVESPDWGVSRRKGKHEALIDLATFQKIQERLKIGAYAPTRKNINEDFPLRGFVACADCNNALCSCWSKGKNKKYPYYLCQTKSCPSYGKSIRKDEIERDFEALLKKLEPSTGLVKFAKAMLENAWQQRLEHTALWRKQIQVELLKVEKQIDNLLDRLVETTNKAACSAYERKIAELENSKLLTIEKLDNGLKPRDTIEHILEHALQFLANPWKIWRSGDYHAQQLVLRLAFSERLVYCRNKGPRTPKLSLPFKMLEDITHVRKEMVGQVGLEPTTRPL